MYFLAYIKVQPMLVVYSRYFVDVQFFVPWCTMYHARSALPSYHTPNCTKSFLDGDQLEGNNPKTRKFLWGQIYTASLHGDQPSNVQGWLQISDQDKSADLEGTHTYYLPHMFSMNHARPIFLDIYIMLCLYPIKKTYHSSILLHSMLGYELGVLW